MDTHNVTTSNIDFKRDAATVVSPDRSLAERHIELLTGSRDTPMHFRLILEKANGKSEVTSLVGPLAECWAEIVDRNTKANAQVYIVVNPGGYDDPAISGIRAFFIDFDDKLPPKKWHATPDFITRRGERFSHAYWLVNDMPVAEFKAAQQRLIGYYGSDPAIQAPSHLMRLAGTVHLKYPKLNEAPSEKRDGKPRLFTIDPPLRDQWDVRSAAELLRGLPEAAAGSNGPHEANSALVAENSIDLAEAISLIPNADLEWSEWNKRGAALFNATKGSEIGKALWLGYSAQSRKYDERDALARWEHWRISPMTEIGAGTLYHLAGEACPGWERPSRRAAGQRFDHATGWESTGTTTPPPANDLGLWLDQHTAASGAGTNAFLSYMHQKRSAAPGYTPPPLAPPCLTAAELDAYEAVTPEDTWLGFLPAQLVTLLYADGGTGKTVFGQWVAVHVAAGLPLFGRPVKQQPVVMVLCEDDYRRVRFSMRAICAHLDVKLADLPITFYCTPDDPLLAVIEDKGEVAHRPFLRTLVDKIAALGECLVVLDTVSDIAVLNENLRLPVTSLCKRVLQPICKELGATVLVNCHPSETQIKAGRMGSGTTAWHNAVRSKLVLIANDDMPGWYFLSNKRAHGGKNNYGECAPLRLKRDGLIFSVAPDEQQLEEAKVHEGFLAMCAWAAIEWAEHRGHPIARPNPTHKKAWNEWPDGTKHLAQECLHRFGLTPGAAHFWQHLHQAEQRHYLAYLTREATKGNKLAGYYRGTVAIPPLPPLSAATW